MGESLTEHYELEPQAVTGLVLLEGPDCAGKTTLARYLVDTNKGHYIHLGYQDELWALQANTLYEAALLSTYKLVVIDRHWVSDQVYAQTFRPGEGNTSTWEARLHDRVLLKHCCVNVACLPGGEECPRFVFEKHAQSTKPELYDPTDERLIEVAQTFYDFYHGNEDSDRSGYLGQLTRGGGVQCRADWLKYDYTQTPMEEMARVILDQVAHWRASQFAPALDGNVMNVLGLLPLADTLLVGDRTNPNKHPKPFWPFFGRQDSSGFLCRTLSELGFDETRAMWCNANVPPEHAYQDVLKDLLVAKRWRHVVAFGQSASQRLVEEGSTSHSVINHPSHAKRFNKSADFMSDLRSIFLL